MATPRCKNVLNPNIFVTWDPITKTEARTKCTNEHRGNLLTLDTENIKESVTSQLECTYQAESRRRRNFKSRDKREEPPVDPGGGGGGGEGTNGNSIEFWIGIDNSAANWDDGTPWTERDEEATGECGVLVNKEISFTDCSATAASLCMAGGVDQDGDEDGDTGVGDKPLTPKEHSIFTTIFLMMVILILLISTVGGKVDSLSSGGAKRKEEKEERELQASVPPRREDDDTVNGGGDSGGEIIETYNVIENENESSVANPVSEIGEKRKKKKKRKREL